jgi:uncharacterized protein (DUF1697 family)
MYAANRIKQEELLKLCRQIENEHVKILGVVKSDNVTFEKRGIHYASVGERLERLISKHFGKKVYVTTRSLATLRRCMNEADNKSEGHHKF